MTGLDHSIVSMFCSFAVFFIFFLKLIGCLNAMIRYDWWIEVGTVIGLVKK